MRIDPERALSDKEKDVAGSRENQTKEILKERGAHEGGDYFSQCLREYIFDG